VHSTAHYSLKTTGREIIMWPTKTLRNFQVVSEGYGNPWSTLYGFLGRQIPVKEEERFFSMASIDPLKFQRVMLAVKNSLCRADWLVPLSTWPTVVVGRWMIWPSDTLMYCATFCPKLLYRPSSSSSILRVRNKSFRSLATVFTDNASIIIYCSAVLFLKICR
jgi:hypothetical protein